MTPMKAFSRHSLVMLSQLFSLRLTRCQVNDCKPGCTPAREQRRSRAKAQHMEWTHVVSTAPPPKGVRRNSASVLGLYPGHGPKVDRLQKGPSHSQVWSMDGFLDA